MIIGLFMAAGLASGYEEATTASGEVRPQVGCPMLFDPETGADIAAACSDLRVSASSPSYHVGAFTGWIPVDTSAARWVYLMDPAGGGAGCGGREAIAVVDSASREVGFVCLGAEVDVLSESQGWQLVSVEGATAREQWRSSTTSASAPAATSAAPAERRYHDFEVPGESFWFAPPHVRGDEDHHGHGPCTELQASEPYVELGRVYVDLRMEAYECGSDRKSTGDRTKSSGATTRRFAFTAPTNWAPVKVLSEGAYSLEYRDTGHSPDSFQGYGAVRSVECVGDTDGDESGTRTGCTVTYRPFKVRAMYTEDPSKYPTAL